MPDPATDLLMIFTRNPQLGKVKTRLAAKTGEAAALKIYKFLLAHTCSITQTLPVTRQVYYSGGIPQEDIWKEDLFEKNIQQGEDLGERMKNAFRDGFRKGYKRIIIIGSDLYDLSSADVYSAFEKLKEQDVVIGPAKDGGYYLLGMKEPREELFQNKKWSTATVLEDTLAHLEGEEVAMLEVRNDVDTFEDIRDREEFQQFLD